MILFYKIHLQAFNVISIVLYHSGPNVWASFVFLSGRLRCRCAWLLGSPHYTPPQCFWSVSHGVVSSILGTSQMLRGSCQDCTSGGEALANPYFFQNFRYCTWGMRPRVNVWSVVTARDLTPVSFFFHFKAPFCRTGTTWPANTHTLYFTDVCLKTVAKIRKIAPSYWPRKRSVRKFLNDLRIFLATYKTVIIQ